MDQGNIRDYNGITFTTQEGAALIKELNLRTQSNDNGYNSIIELGDKLRAIEQALSNSDGNLTIIKSLDDLQNIEPTQIEAENPIKGDVAHKYLTSLKKEIWVYDTSWLKVYVEDLANEPSKPTQIITIPLTGGNTATTNWWYWNSTTKTIYTSGYGTNSSLTPDNTFSSINVQTSCHVAQFNSRVKSVYTRGFSNTGQGLVDIAVIKSKQAASGAFIQNTAIIARENINVNGTVNSGASFGKAFEQNNLFTSINIDAGSEIRVVFNNNNSAVNFLSSVIQIELEAI